MLITITGLSKIDVLLALYDNATFDEIDCASAPSMPLFILKTLMRKRGNGSRKKAEALLKNALRQASIQNIGADPKAREFAKILSLVEEIENQGTPLLWAKDLAKHQNLNSEEIGKNIEQRNSIIKPMKAAL